MSNKHIRVSWCGDIMLLATQREAVRAKFGVDDYFEYVGRLKSVLSGSDYVLANLETPVSPSSDYTDRATVFNSPPELLEAIKDIGIGFVSTANNHCLDRDVRGLDETLAQLDKYGIGHDGTWRNVNDSDRVFVKSIGPIRLAVVCCTFGTNSQHNGIMLPKGEEWRVALTRTQLRKKNIGFNPDGAVAVQYEYLTDDVSPAAINNPMHEIYLNRILDKIRRAKSLADIVAVMPHVGGQYNPAPGAYAKHIVNKFLECGADLVIAGHPHTSLRSQWDAKCFYTFSLGNLSFTPDVGYYAKNTLADYGIILHTYFNTQIKCIERVTFDVVKNCVEEDGCTRVVPVVELFEQEQNLSRRDRLTMEVEAVVNRFRGTGGMVEIQREYEFSRQGVL